MDLPSGIRLAQRMKSWFRLAVQDIVCNAKRQVRKYLLCLSLSDTMLALALLSISLIPFETDHALEINHSCILP